MNRMNVEPATLHGGIYFHDPVRTGERVTVMVETTRVDHDTLETSDFRIALVWPCDVLRIEDSEGLIRVTENFLRSTDHFMGPISYQRLLAAMRDFVRSTNFKLVAGDAPFLQDMPIMGRA